MNCGEYFGTIQDSFRTVSGRFWDGHFWVIVTLVAMTLCELWRIFEANSRQFLEFRMETLGTIREFWAGHFRLIVTF